ncbi:DUF4145 domain-containing protein [Arthrobacter sp. JZ12]|uniref:DUF4145 domain-containing protein n=1 Tax=Arthrobacter sp. JZ12 TaxID=2654190 RepID=UPI002B46A9E0|nr:DUF4145 domain-containing protein [Arthrobacter sp. JZ12]
MSDFWITQKPDVWAPQYVEGQAPADVPQAIAKAAGEAHRGHSIGNYMSAILMARTVIEATAKDKGIGVRGLQPKIEELRAREFIREHVKEEAHEIRHFGNDMAHGDLDIPVVEEDSAEVLTLMDEILNEVYQSPARLAAARERRLARRDIGSHA